MMTNKVMMMKTRLAALGLFSSMLLGLSGCPLQTAAVAVGVSTGDVTVTSNQPSPAAGQNLLLTVSAKASAMVNVGQATWQSSDSTVVLLNSTSGVVVQAMAKKAGTAVITASVPGEGGLIKTGKLTIKVLQSVSMIDVEGPTSLDLGADGTYTAVVKDGDGKVISGASVTWSVAGAVSMLPGGSQTGPTFKVRAEHVGDGAVTAKAGGQTSQVTVKVARGSAKLGVGLSDGTAFPTMIAAGQAVAIRAQYEGLNKVKDDATDAAWTTTGPCTLSRTTGATVEVSGTSGGSCKVTATSGAMSAMASFTIVNVTGIKITGDVSSALKLGATRVLTAVAQSGTTDITGVPVTWSQAGGAVTLSTSGNTATFTGAAVGKAVIQAAVGATMQAVMFAVDPVSLQLSSPGTSVVSGGSALVTVTPKGMNGVSGTFITAEGVALTGATGFTTVGDATLTPGGLVTFALTGATAGSAAVKATLGALSSNALAFTLATVSKVVVGGTEGPVRVGLAVSLTVTVTDAANMPIASGGLPVTWVESNGVITLPATTQGFTVEGMVAKLGTSSIVATVGGVSSAPLALPCVPGSVKLSAFAPTSIAVGGTATATVQVLDVNMAPIPNVPASQVIVTSADATKVSVGAAVAAGNNFTVTATGVSAAPAPGVGLTAKWMGAVEMVQGDTQQVVVAAGQVAWEGACVATPLGPKTWRVSGFQGATSGASTIAYDIYAALGAAAMTSSSKVASDGMSGVAKDVTLASTGADWRFGVVARASDGATSGFVACTTGVTVAAPATSALVLSGAGVYADDTTTAVAATNPRSLLMVAPEGSALVRTAPRQSISFGGGLVGIGIRATEQILYKRPGTGVGADAFALPTALAVVKTESSNGLCTSRAGLTAFELSGKVTAAGALTSFVLYTSAGTATGDAADCALNVLAFRAGATKTIASGVDRVAAFGDHRLGYTFAGALFDVDLTTASKVPRLLADDGLAAGSLIAAAGPTTGTAGAIEATSIYVLSPTGVVSRYTVGAPPLAAPVASVATASLAAADGFVALDADTLLVTSGGTLKVVEVSGAGPLTLGVTARDYSMFGAGAFGVTLGASPLVAQ